MNTEVVMPQMGESIAEGTITRWLKQIGERVERDEPLFEISTDKVDAEIPSPAAGTLAEIKFKEGDTVEVNTVVAIIGDGDGASASAPAAASAEAPKAEAAPAAQAAVASEPPPAPPAAVPSAPPAQPPSPPVAAVASGSDDEQQRSGAQENGRAVSAGVETKTGEPTVEDLRRAKSSPLVRNIAKEHGIDISRLEGTGMSGRVTKNDIMSFIESGGVAAQAPATARTPAPPAPVQAPPATPPQPIAPPMQPSMGDRVEPMSVMRKKIAEHMIISRKTSAHVTTVYEIDMTRIARLRDRHKAAFQQNVGTKLTFMPFIFQAVLSGIRKFPIFNAQVSGEQIIYKQDINLGMAVALDWGLIVPVIKRADMLSIAGLARAANDLADRARSKQLKPDEVAGGTFTITNPGVFGGLFGTPIINQPQVAILGVGAIEKRPKVITTEDGSDVIAIRHMAYFALSFDHRIIDGADAERFLAYVKEVLEAGQFTV
ncbi:MAG: 2-oxoglutarate dehydrogenase, E2 component, dihydrolipoamide succinyltransferase [Acidobacteriota bacterium]|nr:2-oxoglutarate dehydrogenase, E2 component, dihydrolipoamide succinyltransferase [Acidobacteriota bacterium]